MPANLSPRRKLVLLLGWTHAAYRSGLILKYFADRSSDFSIVYLSQFTPGRVPSVIDKLLFLVSGVFFLMRADIVFLMPMSHGDRIMRFHLLLARIISRRLITDFYISAYETKVIDRQLFPPSSGRANALAELDRQVMRLSRPTIFLSTAECRYYQTVVPGAGMCSAPSIIPLVVPERPQARMPFLTGAVLTPTVVWWGRPGNPLHGFDVIAGAIRLLLQRNFPARFGIFCARGIEYENLRKEFPDLTTTDEVLFSSEYSFNDGTLTSFILEHADIALGTFGDTAKAKTVIVNKVLDAASFGLPVITQKSDGLEENFKQGESVVYCDITPTALAAMIEVTLSGPMRAASVGRAARDVVKRHYGPSAFERRFSEMLKDD